jgi:subtilisin family serine protease
LRFPTLAVAFITEYMRNLITAAWLSLSLAPEVGAQHRLPMPSRDPLARIDASVQEKMAGDARVDVMILARTQLFAPVGGLEDFARKNASADRRVLRSAVVADLKKMAATEQSAILRSIGDRPATRLWIINAVATSLTADEIRKVASLDEVRFIYSSVPQPRRAESNGQLREVLSPSARIPFDTAGKRIPWNLQKLGAPAVWGSGVTGEGVVVASLDNGVNYLHPDLSKNIWINRREVANNGKDDDGNGYVDDLYGYDFARMTAEVGAFVPGPGPSQHGSVTSGIVAGDGTGGIVTGVAPRARIMALKGNGLITAPLAFQYALENGADVMSMSFSIPNLGNARGLWRMMTDHAVAAGLVLAGGAGNFRVSARVPVQHQSPKDAPSVISVGGVDSSFSLVMFSSMGPVEWANVELYRDYPMPHGMIKPDVVAFPGAGYPVLAYPSGYIDPNNTTRGNSLSGPQGAGVAALMLSAAPSLPAWRVLPLLKATARDLGDKGPDNQFGAGLIDAAAAVRAAKAERPKH